MILTNTLDASCLQLLEETILQVAKWPHLYHYISKVIAFPYIPFLSIKLKELRYIVSG